MVMLLNARRLYGVLPEHQLPALLEQSRRRQANVTEALAEQVFEALTILLAGFEGAADRDGSRSLKDALSRGEDHVYGGLLAVLLRLVFVLYAEDRGLMPTDEEPYAEDLSVKALYLQLLEDSGNFPDAMSRRFGAWPRLLALFRSIFFGAAHGKLHMPPRRGQLFDPEAYPFLEGWSVGGAPVAPEARAAVQVPSVDDETLFRVLDKLIVLEGQRLSYQSLDVEQIGSVYEALMGYHVKPLTGAGVCLKSTHVWVSADEVLEAPAARRASWFEDEGALDGKQAKAASKALEKAKTEADVLEALEPWRLKQLETKAMGRLVLQPGLERRRTSSHYTPRTLSSPIVRRALEPLLKAMGEVPSSERLLNLKICDPAMGSGAFLVEACRFLADQVVAAWTREGVLTEAPKEEDVVMRARRLVAQRCLYGVDKNPFAVNLAKLSLWLVTLAKVEPFTFLDHALKCGDSLVGLDLEQIRAFRWTPSTKKQEQLDLSGEVFKKALAVALEKRQAILQLALDLERPSVKRPKQLGLDPAKKKEELLRDADEALAPVKRIADACVGAFFAYDSDKEREKERIRRLDVMGAWLAKSEDGVAPAPTEAVLGLTSPPHAFHWALEFPEVFHGKRPDPLDAEQPNKAAWMDAFVGNPPFLRGGDVSSSFGDGYRDWLLCLHADAHGNSDLVAHFFRRAWHLLGINGCMGLIATKTISQGDTRTTGLLPIINAGGLIFSATPIMKWPGAAGVSIAVVHVAKGSVGEPVRSTIVFNGQQVEQINSRLRPKREPPVPQKLAANRGLQSKGVDIYGEGFALEPDERDELLRLDARNDERIFEYIGGEEVNSEPEQKPSRYVISFGSMALVEAEQSWPTLVSRLRETVQKERSKLRDNDINRRLKEFWWQYWADRPEMAARLRRIPRCIVTANVTKHLMMSFQPTTRIFSKQLFVFPFPTERHLVLLQSRIHELWARLLSSSLEDRLRYAASDCFENFPFPEESPFATLDSLGERLDAERNSYLKANQVGLTTTYNRLKDEAVNDPAIISLRRLHEEVDRAVLDAYGWTDVKVPPYCGATPAELEAFEDDVLDRLFDLNERRAKEEGLLASPAAKKKRARA
ncbi:MAG: N-6 DNA methylase [Archangium sp.]|nr:N-6 DNA methylase [Archangium sp.]